MPSPVVGPQLTRCQTKTEGGEETYHLTAKNSPNGKTGSETESTETDGTTTQTDDVSTETDDSSYAPDGGWGWMVTLASFMVAFIVDGTVSSFGLLLPELLRTYGASVSLTSFPSAIVVAMFLLSGPLTAHLVKRWGCRMVGFCGGVLAALGVAGSAYAPSIEVFIITFGVVAGFGIGLIYLPSITMVNIYFHRKRGMVAGIITSGSGFGLLAMAPLTELLIEEYGWRGCYLIMSAITLNFCVCAMLMRPLRVPSRCPHNVHTEDDVSDIMAEGKQANYSLFKAEDDLNSVSVGELEDDGKGLKPQDTHHGSLLNSVKNLVRDDPALSGSYCPISSGGEQVMGEVTIIRSRSHSHLQFSPTQKTHSLFPMNVLGAWLACQVPASLSRHTLHSYHSADKMASGHGKPDPHKGHGMPWSRLKETSRRRCYHSDSRVNWGQSLQHVNRMDDILKEAIMKEQHKVNGTSLLSVQVPTEEATQENPASYSLLSLENSPQPPDDSVCKDPEQRRSLGKWLREYRVFMLFLAGAFLIQLVCNISTLLTPSYAYIHGVSKEEVVTILSIFGVLNTAGRLFAGLLVFCGWRSLHVYNLGTLLAGLACMTFPLCTTFPTIAICMGLQGFFLGAFPPLQSVILVEYLGLERLVSTFGTMCLVKAFGSTAGAPLAGLLYAATGTYTIPVVACGGGLLLAVIFHQMMDCCSSCS